MTTYADGRVRRLADQRPPGDRYTRVSIRPAVRVQGGRAVVGRAAR